MDRVDKSRLADRQPDHGAVAGAGGFAIVGNANHEQRLARRAPHAGLAGIVHQANPGHGENLVVETPGTFQIIGT